MLYYYLIQCRSLTYAQRTCAILERAGITTHMMRSPASVGGKGCGYSVRLSERNLSRALQLLHKAGLDPISIYIAQGDGRYQEVPF